MCGVRALDEVCMYTVCVCVCVFNAARAQIENLTCQTAHVQSSVQSCVTWQSCLQIALNSMCRMLKLDVDLPVCQCSSRLAITLPGIISKLELCRLSKHRVHLPAHLSPWQSSRHGGPVARRRLQSGRRRDRVPLLPGGIISMMCVCVCVCV